jgi:hypothetical protein
MMMVIIIITMFVYNFKSRSALVFASKAPLMLNKYDEEWLEWYFHNQHYHVIGIEFSIIIIIIQERKNRIIHF